MSVREGVRKEWWFLVLSIFFSQLSVCTTEVVVSSAEYYLSIRLTVLRALTGSLLLVRDDIAEYYLSIRLTVLRALTGSLLLVRDDIAI